MKVTITIEDSDIEGVEDGEYVIDNYTALGVERHISTVRGEISSDERNFAAVGRLVEHPLTVTFPKIEQ